MYGAKGTYIRPSCTHTAYCTPITPPLHVHAVAYIVIGRQLWKHYGAMALPALRHHYQGTPRTPYTHTPHACTPCAPYTHTPIRPAHHTPIHRRHALIHPMHPLRSCLVCTKVCKSCWNGSTDTQAPTTVGIYQGVGSAHGVHGSNPCTPYTPYTPCTHTRAVSHGVLWRLDGIQSGMTAWDVCCVWVAWRA